MPASLAAPPQSPGRARSVSQPLREGIETEFFRNSYISTGNTSPRSSFARTLSNNSQGEGYTSYRRGSSGPTLAPQQPVKGRARSGSLVTVTEVGGDEPDNVNDRLGVGANHNAAWVNAPGAWMIHPVLILIAKVLIGSIPWINEDLSWTIVNLGYMALSFLMFHHVTGVPFETTMSTGGAYDDLTMWEQIDQGAQYTPAKKWLTSVPIGLFLISTHYTNYDPTLFAINITALVIALVPKLPILHRLRFHFLDFASTDGGATPAVSRRPSPAPRNPPH